MHVITCLDQRNGVLFNHRRQSRDRLLISHVLENCKGSELYISPFSADLFLHEPGITVAENPLSAASTGDFCFIEGLPLAPVEKEIEELILYRWDKTYPADTYFDLDLRSWHLKEQVDFAGYSHEIITKEVYSR